MGRSNFQESDTITRLFLTGYRGTGKTTVARLVADRLGWNWIDSDHQIEQTVGKTIAQIFADQGEPAFRDLEEQVVADLSTHDQIVIALGGGAILREATQQRLVQAGPVVWLQASATVIAERLANDRVTADQRPSLTGQGVLDEIEQVLAEREPIYSGCATLTVDTESKSPEEVAEEILRGLSVNH